jgi:hypothetical protein
MPDDDIPTGELLERIERLEKAVSELQAEKDVSHSVGRQDGTDHRDAAVINYIQRHGDPGTRKTVELYKKLTDISREETAKRRAKNLRKSKRFSKLTA